MDNSTRFLDAHGANPQDVTWTDVFAAVDRIKAFFAAVSNRFVERDDVIRRIQYALLMREHLLLIGPTGSGKTALVNCVLDNIAGANVFRLGMSDDRTKTEVLGPWCLTRLRAGTGYWHLTGGYLPEAHYARLGEFFDAGDGLLRTLLDSLNERRLYNGPQQMRMPLMTAFADTNFTPEQMPARLPQLDAVVDRFLFRVNVPYPKDRVSDQRMIDASLVNAQKEPIVPISLEDLILVSGVIACANLVLDRYVKEAYTDIVRGVSDEREKQGRAPLSPRRKVWAAQCMEVSALFAGRTSVTMDDLASARYGIAIVPADEELFDKQIGTWQPHWIEKSKRCEIEKELDGIVQMTQGVPDALDLSKHLTTDLRKSIAELTALRAQVESLAVTSVDAHDLRNKQLRKIDEHIDAMQVDLIAKLAAFLPPEPKADADLNQLGEIIGITKQIKEGLDAIVSRSDRVRDLRAAAIDRTLRISTAVELAMLERTGSAKKII